MTGWLDDLERLHGAVPSLHGGVEARDGSLYVCHEDDDWDDVLSCCNVADERIEYIAALLNAAPRLIALARAAEPSDGRAG